MLALGVGLILCRNVQLVTGYTVQPALGLSRGGDLATLGIATLMTVLPGSVLCRRRSALGRGLRVGVAASRACCADDGRQPGRARAQHRAAFHAAAGLRGASRGSIRATRAMP